MITGEEEVLPDHEDSCRVDTNEEDVADSPHHIQMAAVPHNIEKDFYDL